MMIFKSTEIVCLNSCICVQTQPKTKLKLGTPKSKSSSRFDLPFSYICTTKYFFCARSVFQIEYTHTWLYYVCWLDDFLCQWILKFKNILNQ